MEKIYFTTDADGQHIFENADIKSIEAADLTDELNSIFEDSEVITVEPGDFGDCWLKQGYEPTEENWLEPDGVPFDDLIIQRPGSHPGGNCFWISIRPLVYVATEFTELDVS